MAEHIGLYQRAFYYDIALARDVTREVDFLQAVFARLTGRELASALEIACGPGYHSRQLARRGVRAVGLDLMPEMVAFARDKAAAEGISADWLAADMRSFTLSQPVQMAYCLFDALDCLTLDEDILGHFRAVAASLQPGGLYLVDFAHPREIGLGNYADCRYSGERDGIRVDIRWGVNHPRYDIVTWLAHAEIEIEIDDHGHKTTLRDSATERLFLPNDLRLLAKMSGVLEPVAWFGDYNVEQPLDYSPNASRAIVVYRKIG